MTAEDLAGAYFTVDHIIPESLGGATVPDNLCLACWGCNLAKQDRIAVVDPTTSALARLFNPNTQLWRDHFAWEANRRYK